MLLQIILFTCLKQDRIHWIECHEETWCPLLFREIIRNSIQLFWCVFGLTNVFGSPAETVASIIYEVQQKHMNNNMDAYKLTILDLCSGSGGPITIITEQLNKHIDTTTIVTDLFPHLTKWKLLSSKNKNIKYCTIPVDATQIDSDKIEKNLNLAHQTAAITNTNIKNIYLRSIFGAFHHFSPDVLTRILYDVIKCNDDFIAVEITDRGSIFDFLLCVFECVVIIPLLIVMQIKYYFIDQYYELSLLQKVYNSLIMIVSTPVWGTIFVNDGIISNARCYKQKEMMNLTQMATDKAKKDGITIEYEWKCWNQRSNMMFPFSFLLPMSVLYGQPKRL